MSLGRQMQKYTQISFGLPCMATPSGLIGLARLPKGSVTYIGWKILSCVCTEPSYFFPRPTHLQKGDIAMSRKVGSAQS